MQTPAMVTGFKKASRQGLGHDRGHLPLGKAKSMALPVLGPQRVAFTWLCEGASHRL